jgi:hypothetical protein
MQTKLGITIADDPYVLTYFVTACQPAPTGSGGHDARCASETLLSLRGSIQTGSERIIVVDRGGARH